jgi:hypothetical protein
LPIEKVGLLLFTPKKPRRERPHIYLLSFHHPVKGITKTTKNHESIRTNVGAHHDNNRFEVVTGEELKGQLFRDVVFCAPPSGFDDYPAAVQDAATNIWDQSAGGVFVFTSSGGV